METVNVFREHRTKSLKRVLKDLYTKWPKHDDTGSKLAPSCDIRCTTLVVTILCLF